MKDNKDIQVESARVILVPYEAHHVPKYHNWMESEELREQTASERLTVQEEYDMQRKWREDPDKCTFIILDKEMYKHSSYGDAIEKETDAMVGDVNIFYVNDELTRSEGEVEIMIAEPSARGKGFGKEALCCMMKYARENLGTKKFSSKIGFSNIASLGLFKSLGFKEVSRSDIFQEITFLLDEASSSMFMEYAKDYKVVPVFR